MQARNVARFRSPVSGVSHLHLAKLPKIKRVRTACGRGAEMAGDSRSFCVDSLMLEALDFRITNKKNDR